MNLSDERPGRSAGVPEGDDEFHQRLEAKRVQFYTAAEPLFERYGFKKTTVEEVCAAAKASKRTFYELFQDKSELFILLLVHITRGMIERYKARVRAVPSAVDRLRLYLESYVEAVTERPVFQQIMENPKLLSQMTDEVHTGRIQMEALVVEFTELVEYGISTGEFRPMDPGIITWIIHALMDGLFMVASDMHPTEGFTTSPEFIREVWNFILQGFGVQGSQEAFNAARTDQP